MVNEMNLDYVVVSRSSCVTLSSITASAASCNGTSITKTGKVLAIMTASCGT